MGLQFPSLSRTKPFPLCISTITALRWLIDSCPLSKALCSDWYTILPILPQKNFSYGQLCEMKRKWANMILGRLYDLALWPHPWPWPWSFKVRVWNNFISGMGRPIDNERKGCGSSIHDHDIDLCDHGGVGDVPDSDRGDFRCRRAVDISS